MKSHISESLFNQAISRRTFLSKSISTAVIGTAALNALSVFAHVFNLDEEKLITLFTHEFTGFNGEALDPVTGNYMLGNGYRGYNPFLMRFMSQDSLSPFSDAGINAYQYCHGDPINRIDPSGHLDGSKLGLGIFAVLTGIAGAIAAPFTGGTSIAIAAGIIGSVASAISGVLTISAAAIEQRNPDTAQKLDIASWAFTGISLAAGAVGVAGEVAQGFKTPGFVTNLSKGRLGQSRFKTDIKFRTKANIKSRGTELAEKANKTMLKIEAGEAQLKAGHSDLLIQVNTIKADKLAALKLPNYGWNSYVPKNTYGTKGILGSRMMKTHSLKKGINSPKFILSFGSSIIKQAGSLGTGVIGIVVKANKISEQNNTESNELFTRIAHSTESQYSDRVVAPGLSRMGIIHIDTNAININTSIRQGIFTV
ncbi:RHS repeat-associated core domain-containing protein [Vibrio cholerae]|uniref:RHS repeat-associated core domain-containing protein n=1 Tax=Vibrio cholerae TaxID=666 RepID=UPI001644F4F8|nr:RHS repeat-associated core domain-containing protein [Vibrio cholerae]